MSGRLGMTGAGVVRGDAVVAKSYVPGRGFVSASKMPREELRALAQGGRRRMQAGRNYDNAVANTTFRNGQQAARNFMDEHKSFHSTKGAVQPRVLDDAIMNRVGGKDMGAFTMRTGSRRGGTSRVYARPGTSRETLIHEGAHAEPKRTGFRMHQISSSPRKQMREEARADYLSGVHYQHNPSDSGYAHAARDENMRRQVAGNHQGHYTFSRAAMTNYRDVQNRMSYAGTKVRKVQTTMSDKEARQLARRYDTRGPLPNHLTREQKMKAYEARYIASGGRKAEKWKRRADGAEVGRNVGLAGVTAAGALTLARRAPLVRRIPHHVLERAAVGAGTFGGASELYGEHARSRRASYQNSPAGVAGSALSRMQAYTPEKKR